MFWLCVILAALLGVLILFIAFGLASKKAPDALIGRVPGSVPKASLTANQQPNGVDQDIEPAPLWPNQTSSDEPLPIVTGAYASEPEFDEAELMLREVKAMLLQGRPDRAIAHIRAVAGVEEQLAAEFVEEVQQGLLG